MTETPNRNLPLVDPDQPQRDGAARINTALTAVDAEIAALLLALGQKANAADIGPAITAAINALVAGAPAALDTLAEIAGKLADNDDAVAAIMASLATKANAANVYSRATVDGMVSAEATARAAAIAAISFNALRPLVITSGAITAVAGQRIIAITSSGVVPITLPASPVAGDPIDIDRIGGNYVDILRNGKTIEGVADDLRIDNDRDGVRLVYDGNTWRY